jgi:hypothetical protein
MPKYITTAAYLLTARTVKQAEPLLGNGSTNTPVARQQILNTEQ